MTNEKENRFEHLKNLIMSGKGLIILSIDHDGSDPEPTTMIGIEVAQTTLVPEDKEFLNLVTKHTSEIMKDFIPEVMKIAATKSLKDMKGDDVCTCGNCGNNEKRRAYSSVLLEILTELKEAMGDLSLNPDLAPEDMIVHLRKSFEARRDELPAGLFKRLDELEAVFEKSRWNKENVNDSEKSEETTH